MAYSFNITICQKRVFFCFGITFFRFVYFFSLFHFNSRSRCRYNFSVRRKGRRGLTCTRTQRLVDLRLNDKESSPCGCSRCKIFFFCFSTDFGRHREYIRCVSVFMANRFLPTIIKFSQSNKFFFFFNLVSLR